MRAAPDEQQDSEVDTQAVFSQGFLYLGQSDPSMTFPIKSQSGPLENMEENWSKLKKSRALRAICLAQQRFPQLSSQERDTLCNGGAGLGTERAAGR